MIRKLIAIIYTLVLCLITTPVYGQDATTTELMQNGRSLKSSILTLDGGLVSNISDLLRDKDSAKVLNNLQMLKKGIWTNVGTGRTRMTDATSSTISSTCITEMAQHTTSAGVNRLVLVNGSIFLNATLNTASSPPAVTLTDVTPAAYSASPQGVPCLRSFNANNLLYVCSNVAPLKWNGDTGTKFSTLGGWPITYATKTYSYPAFVEVFANRACFAGFPDQPSSIVFSDQNDPATYTIGSGATNGGIFECPSQLGKITGLRTLRLANDTTDQVLIVGCERGMAMITGYSGSTFALKDLTREYGLRSNRSWIQLQNDLYFLATDGIRRFSQLVAGSSLLNSGVTFGVQDLINLIDPTKGQLAFAVHHPATQEVHYFVPANTATVGPRYEIILNYNTDGKPGEALTPIISTKSAYTGEEAACGIEYEGKMYTFTNTVGGSTFRMCQEYLGDTYEGTAISWEYFSPLIGANSPSQSASLRKLLVITEGGDQAFTASVFTLDTLANGATEYKARASRSYSVTASTITKYGTWASGTTTTYPKLIDVSSDGNGRYWAIRLTGSSSSDKIALVGVQAVLTVGGWKQ